MSLPAIWRTASRMRRLMRLRTTALPTLRVTVMPRRGGPPSFRSRTSSRKSLPRRFSPPRAARNSARLVRRPIACVPAACSRNTKVRGLGRKTLAAAIAAGSDDVAAALGGHAGTETVAALANKLGGLISALHLFDYRGVRPFLYLSLREQELESASRGQAIARRAASPIVARLIVSGPFGVNRGLSPEGEAKTTVTFR